MYLLIGGEIGGFAIIFRGLSLNAGIYLKQIQTGWTG
jgi:hypothetical protein